MKYFLLRPALCIVKVRHITDLCQSFVCLSKYVFSKKKGFANLIFYSFEVAHYVTKHMIRMYFKRLEFLTRKKWIRLSHWILAKNRPQIKKKLNWNGKWISVNNHLKFLIQGLVLHCVDRVLVTWVVTILDLAL